MGGVSAKPVFYVCGCGCKVPPEKIVQYRGTVDGQSIKQRRCPKHKGLEIGRVISNICRCETCGKLFEGRLAARCPECRKENRRIYMQTYYKKNPDKFSEARDKSRRVLQATGKRDSVDCPLFGTGEQCGKVCIAEFFQCRVMENYMKKSAAA